jgi:tRNA1(Val) A37 N6-methylase TrmN6
MTTSIDGLLNKRVWVEQPKNGFRIAVDTLLLASAVPAGKGHRILDLGCGVGGAMLALAARVPHLTILGIEIQPELADLCVKNIKRNNLENMLSVLCADLRNGEAGFSGFDHVMMNPPFHDKKHHDASKHEGKRRANTDEEGDLFRWIEIAKTALHETGCLTLIHRWDRFDELCSLLCPLFSEIVICPVKPKAEAEPKRVIIRALKGKTPTLAYEKPLILHEADGAYTKEARAILWDAASMDFPSS